MKRITVTLDEAQVAALLTQNQETDIPISAMVRYAVGRMLSDNVIFLSAVHTLSTQYATSKIAKGATK